MIWKNEGENIVASTVLNEWADVNNKCIIFLKKDGNLENTLISFSG